MSDHLQEMQEYSVKLGHDDKDLNKYFPIQGANVEIKPKCYYDKLENYRRLYWLENDRKSVLPSNVYDETERYHHFRVNVGTAPFYSSLTVFEGYAHSIKILDLSSINRPCRAPRLDIHPSAVNPLIQGITKVIIGESPFEYILNWGCKTTITVVAEVVAEVVRISERRNDNTTDNKIIANSIFKKKQIPINIYLPPTITSECSDSLALTHENARELVKVLLMMKACMSYLYEIRAQRLATFKIVSEKMQDDPNPTKEDYYWYVISSFFSLKVKERNSLPACIVLGDFFYEYTDEHYSLYKDKNNIWL